VSDSGERGQSGRGQSGRERRLVRHGGCGRRAANAEKITAASTAGFDGGHSSNNSNDNNDTSCSLKHHITATSDSKQCRQFQLFTIMTTAFYPMTAFPPISRTLSPIIRCSCPAHKNAHVIQTYSLLKGQFNLETYIA